MPTKGETKPAKGRKWKANGCGCELTETGRFRPDWPNVLEVETATCRKEPAHFTHMGVYGDGYTLVSPPPVGTGGGRDWSRWLPPGPLPDTGAKEPREGQVWAVDYGKGADVRRIGSPDGTLWCCEILVGLGGSRVFPDCTALRHAILVADVDCEPTPPEVLYAASPPPLEAPRGPVESLTPSTPGVGPPVAGDVLAPPAGRLGSSPDKRAAGAVGSTPTAAPLPQCEWKTQVNPGSTAYAMCGNRVAHDRVNLCEAHISEAMIAAARSPEGASSSNLPSFSLPGDVSPQRRPYFTPTRTPGAQ